MRPTLLIHVVLFCFVIFRIYENFTCLYLNTKNQVIHRQTIFIGSLNTSIVHPREVFKEAFRRAAASIICLHNQRGMCMFPFTRLSVILGNS
ncbi:hypothetical protein COM24_10380 [Bacillus toyonensis]|nr:hypothetical protein COM24_10380 [Bacillus toyonensis]